ncbi:hypothetical protein ACTA71_007898 [Dictyostelium dimigraforme]
MLKMDFVSGLDSCTINQFDYNRILVVIDRLSKFVVLVPTHTLSKGIIALFSSLHQKSFLMMIYYFPIDQIHNSWYQFVKIIQFTINNTISATIKFTPFRILLGAKPKLPFSLIIQYNGDSNSLE